MAVDVNKLTESINRFDETSIKLKEVSDLVKDSIAVKDDMNSSINKINEEVDNLGKENRKNLKSLETTLTNKTQEYFDQNIKSNEQINKTVSETDDKIEKLFSEVSELSKSLKQNNKNIEAYKKMYDEKLDTIENQLIAVIILISLTLLCSILFH